MMTRSNEVVYAARSKRVHGEIVCGDAVDFLKNLQRESARVVFLDPPFNLGKQYGSRKNLDRLPENEYRLWLESVASESIRVLEPGGSLFLYHVPLWAMRLGAYLDGKLRFQQWIAISMKNGFVRGNRLYPAHYALMMFTKGKPKRFLRPRISPQECRTCGELIRDYGGYKPIIRRKGINLSDIWDDLSPVRHSIHKHRPANELPPLLFHRVFTMVGYRGGLYVDPFGGAGTGIVAAGRRGMRFATCDIVRANCLLMKTRIIEYSATAREKSRK
ncbi:MAG TPA: DNA methyltransferase [Candidatus Dormibacteraeota bacterium]|nr:DNA methyltransferase [Candidatus Dormibacteraeota bacterium]